MLESDYLFLNTTLLMTALPYKDYTIKAPISNSEIIECVLKNIGALFIGTDHQTDLYFETPVGKLKLRQGTIENLITHYERITRKSHPEADKRIYSYT